MRSWRRARAHLEREFAFGVVRQLFEPVLADGRARERLLAGAAAPAAPVFEAVAPPGAGAGDGSFAALHGLYWLALNLADERPLLLVVDDLHWCDAPSLRFLAYLGAAARRLPDVLALGCAAASPARPGALAELAPSADALRVRAAAAGREAGAALLIARPPRRGAGRGVLRRACLEATGGNPLLLRQLLRSPSEEVRRCRARRRRRAVGPRAISRTVLSACTALGEPRRRAGAGARRPRDHRAARRRRARRLDDGGGGGGRAALARAEILDPQPPRGVRAPARPRRRSTTSCRSPSA